MKKQILLLVLIFSSVAMKAQNETDVASKLVSFARNAIIFNNNFTQEKAYLHFDNTGYFIGENIWFKAYVVNAMNNLPSDMSKTLHVELLSPEGNIVHSKKLYINNGVCSGDFMLEDSLPAGFYEVRAFTRCMMNFGSEVVFSRVFPVFDPPIVPGEFDVRNMTPRKYTVPNLRSKNPNKEAINVSFFPEGGSLVKGLTSNIAFKAINKQGLSVAITGTVYDENNKEVATIKTQQKGMGQFSLVVNSNKYTVKVKSDKSEGTITLPTPLASGYVMTCSTVDSDSLNLRIKKSEGHLEGNSLAMAVTSRGKLMDYRSISVSDQGTTVGFQTAKYPAGIYQFTLYNTDGHIESERLVFKYPKVVSNLMVKTNKETYAQYEPVKVTLSSTDVTNIQSGTSISLAVREAASSNFGNSNTTNIATNLLLSSDLKGYIENPAWYFTEKTADRMQALDLLMLTQGWRRYSWNYMAGIEPFTAKHPIEEGILIDGEVRSVIFKKPVPNADLRFWMTQGLSAQTADGTTDSLGHFAFVFKMYGNWEANIETQVKSKQKDFRILLNRTFSPQPNWYSDYDQDVWTDNKPIEPTPIDTATSILGILSYSKKSTINAQGIKEILLEDVVTTAKRKQKYYEQVARLSSISYNLNKEIDSFRDVGETEASSVVKMLEIMNPYFSIKETDSSETYKYKGKDARFQIFSSYAVNDLGVSSTDLPSELLPQDVEKMFIVEDDQALRQADPMYDGSYINIVIYKYPAGQQKEVLGVRKTIVEGYAVPREFYAPSYQAGTAIVEPDLRRTLYWNSDVILDKNGKATVEFFNNKTAKRLDVSAEGITGNGTLLLHE